MEKHEDWLLLWNFGDRVSGGIEFFTGFLSCFLGFFVFFGLELSNDSSLLLLIVVWRNSLQVAELVFDLTEAHKHGSEILDQVMVKSKVELGGKLS